ncbi:MAG: hypothetical protein ACLGI2_05300 [Acidimicrobiia bacterium]
MVSDLVGRSQVHGGVRIVRWPADRELLHQLSRRAVPRLVVVADGSEPPVAADCCQDWMRASGDERELRARLRGVALRSLGHGHGQPRLDDSGTLRVGPRGVHLAPKERGLAAVLVDRFNDHVPAEELIRAVWPDGIPRRNVLASRMSGLRARLVWLGLEVRGNSTAGYSMGARMASQAPATSVGFEDQVDVRPWLG